MVMISERPAEAADRAVPGHWEGDLIIGKDCRSAVGTLVERTTRYLLLLHLPHGRDAHRRRTPSPARITALPARLARTLTWDQGIEMACHAALHHRHRHPGLLLRPARTLAARLEREHLLVQDERRRISSTGEAPAQGRRVTRRTRAEKLSVDMSTAARRARALTGSDLIEAC